MEVDQWNRIEDPAMNPWFHWDRVRTKKKKKENESNHLNVVFIAAENKADF